MKKYQKGGSLVFVIITLAFLGAIGFTSYEVVTKQSINTAHEQIKNKTFISAENAIKGVLDMLSDNTESQIFNNLSALSNNKIISCWRNGETFIYNSEESNLDCSEKYSYSKEDYVIQSKTSMINDLCLSWGSSDKHIKCFQIDGYGSYYQTDIYSNNIQETQIIEIKKDEVGIYEF